MATVGKTPYKKLSIPNHYDPSMEEYRKNMISIDSYLHQVFPDENSAIYDPNITDTGIYMLYGDSALDNDIGFLEVYSHIVGGTLFTSQCFRSLTKPESVLYRTCTGGESWSSWVKYANILNGGEGSGFDADKIDGKHLSSLFTTDKTETDFNNAVLSGQYFIGKTCSNSPGSNNEDWMCVVYCIEGTIYQLAFQTSNSINYFDYGSGINQPKYLYAPAIYVRRTYSDTDVIVWGSDNSGSNYAWTAWQIIWHSGVDGKDTGLDADKLDGLHASSMFRTDYLRTDFNDAVSTGKYSFEENPTNPPVSDKRREKYGIVEGGIVEGGSGSSVVSDKWVCLVYNSGNAIIQIAIERETGIMYTRFALHSNFDGNTWGEWNVVNSPTKIASGESFVSILDCAKNTPLIDYSIKGNSIQYSGYRYGKNLLPYPYYETTKTENGITFTDNGDGTITANGTADELAQFILSLDVELNKGTYTFSGCPSGGSSSTYCISDSYENIDTGDAFTLSFESDSSKEFVILIQPGTTVSNLVFKPQIELGSTATEYEQYTKYFVPSPENPVEIQSVGDLVTDTASEYYGKYDIPITVTGKNLFDKSISVDDSIKNETVNTSTTYSIGVLRPNKICEILKPNTKYTISCEFECESIPADTTLFMDGLGFSIYSAVSGYSSANATTNKQLSAGEIFSLQKTITTPSKFDSGGDYRFIIYRNAYKDADGNFQYPAIICRNIQIEECSYATEYEPYKGETTHIYLNEPLRKIGDYADYIDFKNQKVVRNINSMLIKAKATLNNNETDETAGFYFRIDDRMIINDLTNIQVLSPSLPGVPRASLSKDTSLITAYPDNSAVAFKLSKTLIGGDTSVLVNKYLENNPIIVYYILATPTENNIQLPILKSPDSVKTEVSIDTSTPTSITNVTYLTSPFSEFGDLYKFMNKESDDENFLERIKSVDGIGSGINADRVDNLHGHQLTKYGTATRDLVTTDIPTTTADGSSAMYRFYDSGNIIGEGSNVYYGIIQIYYSLNYYMRIAVSMSSGKVYRQTSGATAWNEITPVIPVVSEDPSSPSEGQMWILNS